MQVPLGQVIVDGKFVPVDSWSIVTGPMRGGELHQRAEVP